jgi:cephalosporin-C deacetylase-like acetyl esterase
VKHGLAAVLGKPPKAAMLPDFVDACAARLEVLHSARPPAASLARRNELLDAVTDCLGIARLPCHGAPARTVGTLERDGYTIEKLVFEALPGLPAPALLYRPTGASRPHPAVVHPPGHWMENAKLEPDLQRTNTWLARSGVAVLCYDTLGQGERRVGWHQHGQLGTLLAGFTTVGTMVAESRRALDLLAERDDIDASRLGLLGASGGGWSSIFTAAVDERVRAAAIVCIVNTHRGQIRAARGTGWDGAVCLCNQLPGLAALGSIAEIMGLVAPRALLQVNAVDDPPFPIEGARRVAGELRGLFSAAGAADALEYAEVNGGHGLRPEARTVTVQWLCRRLGLAPPPRERADEPLLEAPYRTTYADVADDPTARQDYRRGERVEGECLGENVDSNVPLLELARSRAAELRARRRPATRADLLQALGPFPEPEPIGTIVENRVQIDGGHAERLSFSSEAGVRLDGVLVLPDVWSDAAPPVVVVLDQAGKSAALDSPEAAFARTARCALLAPDLRGTGESACAEWETGTAAFMLDRDLLSQRVWDARRSVEAVWRRAVVGQQVDRGRIVLWGRGSFALVALAAAALDERIAGAGTNGFVDSLEALLTVLPEETPMLYRYRLLELVDVGELERLIRPRPVVRDDVGALLEALA